jgi:hypothetical protein
VVKCDSRPRLCGTWQASRCPDVSPTVRSDETGKKHAAETLTSWKTHLRAKGPVHGV